VLLAEDNEVNANITHKILAKLGIESVVVENGVLALNETMKNTFDLILMDINMPTMNGFIRKPIKLERLIEALDSILNSID
jgi:CheY-like chemotaxis protein